MDGYIRTPERFRKFLEKTGVPEGLPEPPGEVMGLSGPRGEARPRGGKPTPSRFGPPFLLGVGEGRKREEGRRKGGPPPSQF